MLGISPFCCLGTGKKTAVKKRVYKKSTDKKHLYNLLCSSRELTKKKTQRSTSPHHLTMAPRNTMKDLLSLFFFLLRHTLERMKWSCLSSAEELIK